MHFFVPSTRKFQRASSHHPPHCRGAIDLNLTLFFNRDTPPSPNCPFRRLLPSYTTPPRQSSSSSTCHFSSRRLCPTATCRRWWREQTVRYRACRSASRGETSLVSSTPRYSRRVLSCTPRRKFLLCRRVQTSPSSVRTQAFI